MTPPDPSASIGRQLFQLAWPIMALNEVMASVQLPAGYEFEEDGGERQFEDDMKSMMEALMVGIVLYALVKAVNKFRGQTAIVPESDHDLLAQIRDELRTHPRSRDMGTQVAPVGTH